MMVVFAVAFLMSLLALPPLLVVLRRAQVIDHPSARSSHLRPTLRGGGLAVVLAITVAIGLAVRAGLVGGTKVVPAVIVLIGLAALGFREDVHGVPTGRRLGVQLLVALVAGAGLFLSGAAPWMAVALVAAVVVYTNAFNFMDGVNGISALNAAFAGVAYAVIGAGFDTVQVTVVGLAVAGAALGFLPFNVPAAKVFLGDSGSYALGGVVAVLAVQCLAAGAPLMLCIAPVSVYLADTGWTLLTRHRHGDSLVIAHREHAYQRLADVVGHVGAAASTVVVAAVVSLMAYAGGESAIGGLVGGVVGALLLMEYLAAPSAVQRAPMRRTSAATRPAQRAAARPLARTQAI